MTHDTALVPPSRHLPIEEIEEQAQRHEAKCEPQVVPGSRVDAVAHGRGDGHEAAEAVHQRDEVGKMVGADQTEVAGVLRVQEDLLLVVCCTLLACGL